MTPTSVQLSAETRLRLILEELDRASNVSQRELADHLHMALGAVNRYIGQLLDGGYIQVVDRGVRPFAYRLTMKGKEYRHRLSHEHYRSVLGDLKIIRERIETRLMEMKREGVNRVACYGAGEVMELMFPITKRLGMEVVGLVDDDSKKWGRRKGRLRIDPPDTVVSIATDAVVISTFLHSATIRERLEGLLESSVPVFEL